MAGQTISFTLTSILLILLLRFSSSVVSGVRIGSSSDTHRFQPFCNYICQNATTCPNPTQYDIVPCNQTQTGGGCTLKGCKAWSQGSFPIILPVGNSGGNPRQFHLVNGGVPQRANLTLHLQLLEEQVQHWIPEVAYSGNAVLDFERWTPLWEENDSLDPNWSWHSIIYQNYSILLVQQAHPSWKNLTRIIETARLEFESAGIQFFVATLKTLRKLRPHAKWGFYGFPQGHWGVCEKVGAQFEDVRCGFDNPIVGPYYRSQSDRLAPIWEASNAIYPSVYLQPQYVLEWNTWRLFNQKWVNDTTQEAIRLATTFPSFATANDDPTVVLPFYWAMYHNASTFLIPQDVEMVLQNTYSPPRSTGLIQWGGGGEKGISHFMRNTGGPTMFSFVQAADQCGNNYCSGHGWCCGVTPNSFFVHSKAAPCCICDKGYHGSACEQQGN